MWLLNYFFITFKPAFFNLLLSRIIKSINIIPTSILLRYFHFKLYEQMYRVNDLVGF